MSSSTTLLPLHINIDKLTKENDAYRRVYYTLPHMQVVFMSLKPNEEIGMEVHPDNDQFFRIEEGEGMAIVEGIKYILLPDTVLVVPRGSNHNIINTSNTEKLKLYTIYTPAHHPDGLIQNDKPKNE